MNKLFVIILGILGCATGLGLTALVVPTHEYSLFDYTPPPTMLDECEVVDAAIIRSHVGNKYITYTAVDLKYGNEFTITTMAVSAPKSVDIVAHRSRTVTKSGIISRLCGVERNDESVRYIWKGFAK